MTRADRILLALLVALAVLAVPGAALASRGRDAVRLKGPSGVTVLDPARDGTYRVQGRIGEVVFEVRDGEVRCVSADCPDHVCVRSGTVRAGAPVVCAPNGVVAEFTGVSEGGAVDAVSR